MISDSLSLTLILLALPYSTIKKNSIWIKEGIIKKNSYKRRAYESVDEKSPSLAMSRKTTKKRIREH